MRYIEEVLGILGVLPLGSHPWTSPHGDLNEVLMYMKLVRPIRAGEGSSKERKKFKDTKRE